MGEILNRSLHRTLNYKRTSSCTLKPTKSPNTLSRESATCGCFQCLAVVELKFKMFYNNRPISGLFVLILYICDIFIHSMYSFLALSECFYFVLGFFSVQLCKLNSTSSPTILGIVTQFEFGYILRVCIFHAVSQFQELCAVAVELKRIAAGFVCILSFGSFSSCKVHSFMIVP